MNIFCIIFLLIYLILVICTESVKFLYCKRELATLNTYMHVWRRAAIGKHEYVEIIIPAKESL